MAPNFWGSASVNEETDSALPRVSCSMTWSTIMA